jgi:hypothetical protein
MTVEALDPPAGLAAAGMRAAERMAARVGSKAGAELGAAEAEVAAARLRGELAAGGKKAFSSEKQALVDMAKADKKAGGMSSTDLDAYKELNRGLPDPFAGKQVRGPETHPLRTPSSKPGPGQQPHGHVGPVDHIPIKEDKL